MKKFGWNNGLSVGVELIDLQHKKWIERYKDKFQLVFSDELCKIFKYTGEGA